jgi:hypothetical protein
MPDRCEVFEVDEEPEPDPMTRDEFEELYGTKMPKSRLTGRLQVSENKGLTGSTGFKGLEGEVRATKDGGLRITIADPDISASVRDLVVQGSLDSLSVGFKDKSPSPDEIRDDKINRRGAIEATKAREAAKA